MKVFVIRHGETAWSLSGAHPGTTDIPLTDNGRRVAEKLCPVLAKEAFACIFVRPMRIDISARELLGSVAAAIEGGMGRVFADSQEEPRVALAVLDFRCLAGDPLHEHALLIFPQIQPGDVVIAPTPAWQHLVVTSVFANTQATDLAS